MAYSIALFLHVCGALGLFAAVGIEVTGVLGLRRARTVDQVRTYAQVVKVTEPMFPGFGVMVLLAGSYMTVSRWSFDTPFVMVGLITLVVMSVLGATVQSKRWQKVEEAAHDLPDGPVPLSLKQLIDDPVAWASMGGAIFAAVAVVSLMTTKPGWAVSVLLATGAYAAGGIIGWMFVGRRAVTPVPSVTG